MAATETVGDKQVAVEDRIAARRTLAGTHLRDAAAILARVLVPFVVTRITLVLVGLLALFYLLPLMRKNLTHYPLALDMRVPRTLLIMWERFDSGFYTEIARHGYWPAQSLHHPSNWAFFPLFPMLIHPLARVLGWNDRALVLSGLIVSNTAAIIALCYLYALVRREFDERVALRAVMYLLLFPTGFYLSAVYSESVFLACASACLYYARTRHWWLAGLCGGLAALARVQGVLLLLPLAWEYWQAVSDRYAPVENVTGLPAAARLRLLAGSRLRGPIRALAHGITWLSLPALALVPAGLLSFMLYARLKTGDFLATFHNQSQHWGRYFVPPWTVLKGAILHPHAANPTDWNFYLLNMGMALLFLCFTLWAFWRLPAIYGFYSLVMVLSPLSSSRLNSIGRYYLVVFPAVMLLALWSSRDGRPERSFAITTLFASLQAVFMIFFVLGLPAIA